MKMKMKMKMNGLKDTFDTPGEAVKESERKKLLAEFESFASQVKIIERLVIMSLNSPDHLCELANLTKELGMDIICKSILTTLEERFPKEFHNYKVN